MAFAPLDKRGGTAPSRYQRNRTNNAPPGDWRESPSLEGQLSNSVKTERQVQSRDGSGYNVPLTFTSLTFDSPEPVHGEETLDVKTYHSKGLPSFDGHAESPTARMDAMASAMQLSNKSKFQVPPSGGSRSARRRRSIEQAQQFQHSPAPITGVHEAEHGKMDARRPSSRGPRRTPVSPTQSSNGFIRPLKHVIDPYAQSPPPLYGEYSHAVIDPYSPKLNEPHSSNSFNFNSSFSSPTFSTTRQSAYQHVSSPPTSPPARLKTRANHERSKIASPTMSDVSDESEDKAKFFPVNKEVSPDIAIGEPYRRTSRREHSDELIERRSKTRADMIEARQQRQRKKHQDKIDRSEMKVWNRSKSAKGRRASLELEPPELDILTFKQQQQRASSAPRRRKPDPINTEEANDQSVTLFNTTHSQHQNDTALSSFDSSSPNTPDASNHWHKGLHPDLSILTDQIQSHDVHQRPPSRQLSPFPTFLDEVDNRRKKVKDNSKKTSPNPPVSPTSLNAARPVARHKPPSESMFLESFDSSPRALQGSQLKPSMNHPDEQDILEDEGDVDALLEASTDTMLPKSSAVDSDFRNSPPLHEMRMTNRRQGSHHQSPKAARPSTASTRPHSSRSKLKSSINDSVFHEDVSDRSPQLGDKDYVSKQSSFIMLESNDSFDDDCDSDDDEGVLSSRMLLEKDDPFQVVITNSKTNSQNVNRNSSPPMNTHDGYKDGTKLLQSKANAGEDSDSDSEDEFLETSLDVEFLGLFSA